MFSNFQLSVASLSKPTSAYKVYQTMFRVIKESETVDARQHCFLLQSSPPHTTPRYLSLETRQELLRIENSWNSTIITSVIKLGVSKLIWNESKKFKFLDVPFSNTLGRDYLLL